MVYFNKVFDAPTEKGHSKAQSGFEPGTSKIQILCCTVLSNVLVASFRVFLKAVL